MLLIPFLDANGGLTLDGFSFNANELSTVTQTLRNAQIMSFAPVPIGMDRAARIGFRWIINATDVEKLESRLELKFLEYRTHTVAAFKKGSGYKCKEIQLSGPGPGCVDMSALDANDALVKCALIAGKNFWFGGAPAPGNCS
jgi:hypothetical protein